MVTFIAALMRADTLFALNKPSFSETYAGELFKQTTDAAAKDSELSKEALTEAKPGEKPSDRIDAYPPLLRKTTDGPRLAEVNDPAIEAKLSASDKALLARVGPDDEGRAPFVFDNETGRLVPRPQESETRLVDVDDPGVSRQLSEADRDLLARVGPDKDGKSPYVFDAETGTLVPRPPEPKTRFVEANDPAVRNRLSARERDLLARVGPDPHGRSPYVFDSKLNKLVPRP